MVVLVSLGAASGYFGTSMKPSIIRLTVALITLIIGITLFSFTRFSRSQVSPETVTVKVPDVIPIKPPLPPEESPAPPQDGKIPRGTDLSIVVELSGNPPTFDVRHISLGKNPRTTVELDLVENIDGQEVTLHFRDRSLYRIHQRYRTSMGVSVEGPHLDLLDWRHFDSPWTPLKSLGANRFLTLSGEQMDDTRFPKTTKSEIIKEVHKRGKDWPELLEFVKSCNGPNDGACYVAISSIYLRIQKQVGDRWIDVGMVEFAMPMGC